ncbi:ABC transporter substrate-binding protein [Telmatospirillum sp.]|uniref:ABC transporter substrate-binding protein n=1 Tax=Telmatospirillum sp. TaxID=2079197 RepID=UPI002841DA64|nr:ABC transporter substrate-binding protein [Telmatospirillum sp.]MDR3438133.1 ABC transporter substrate-binding protein [Telmatospirillum sp.]
MFKKCFLLVSAAALALAAPATAKDLKTIGVSVGNMGNPFFVQVVKGAEEGAKAINKDVKVIAGGVDYDLNKQFTQIDNFIAAGVDMVLINAVDPVAIEPAMKRLHDAGIIAVAVDVSGKGADATVTSNNVQAGEKSCQYIVEKLKGKGNVVILNGPPVSAVIDRVNGCKSVLAKSPDIKILSDNQNAKGSREGALEVMVGTLTAFDNIDAVFSINDPQSIGADLAAKQLGRTNLFITSVDGAPDIEGQLKDKNSLIEASAAQDPFAMAKKAVEVGYQIMQGHPPANPTTLIPVELITRDNISSYKGWSSK